MNYRQRGKVALKYPISTGFGVCEIDPLLIEGEDLGANEIKLNLRPSRHPPHVKIPNISSTRDNFYIYHASTLCFRGGRHAQSPPQS